MYIKKTWRIRMKLNIFNLTGAKFGGCPLMSVFLAKVNHGMRDKMVTTSELTSSIEKSCSK